MRVSTKTGDKGTTSLIGGTRVSKADVRLEAYGTADELNSFIGWLRAAVDVAEIDEWLARIQNAMFCLGGYLALDQSKCAPAKGTSVERVEVMWLETLIDKMEAELPVVRAFIIPGGSEAISRCHICRTVCRRLERCITQLFGEEEKWSENDEIVLQYVNRLSDFLFILSKKIAQIEKNELFLWKI
ncbi:MAG: cob(I)yrinic acid a,c-diamide adenosyltransferase [Paludibacteraceae bacterium]|nr:cob(I)yrinic acid a,c-diamide adenosyltransferase [Paludibacteraceae bacterium]